MSAVDTKNSINKDQAYVMLIFVGLYCIITKEYFMKRANEGILLAALC